jgi:hypothetical protein
MSLAPFMPALTAALRMHEIGKGTPYKLYFASKGKSGGSFGFMQGDLAAGQKAVTKTFVDVMEASGISNAKTQQLLGLLSKHIIGNPLSPQDTSLVNAALASHMAEVDAMDQDILADVCGGGLQDCMDVAQAHGRTISGKALLYAALWINMSGAPTKLKVWLSGGDPHLNHPVPTAPPTVKGSDIRAYLMATSYYVANPGNAAHLDESVQAGEPLLP